MVTCPTVKSTVRPRVGLREKGKQRPPESVLTKLRPGPRVSSSSAKDTTGAWGWVVLTINRLGFPLTPAPGPMLSQLAGTP